jgi:hypothetical protein
MTKFPSKSYSLIGPVINNGRGGGGGGGGGGWENEAASTIFARIGGGFKLKNMWQGVIPIF